MCLLDCWYVQPQQRARTFRVVRARSAWWTHRQAGRSVWPARPLRAPWHALRALSVARMDERTPAGARCTTRPAAVAMSSRRNTSANVALALVSWKTLYSYIGWLADLPCLYCHVLAIPFCFIMQVMLLSGCWFILLVYTIEGQEKVVLLISNFICLQKVH